MIEWWTYRPSDFLMFAPRTWWRLFELHNAGAWPLQPMLLAGGLVLLAGWRRIALLRAGLALLALATAAVAWFFLWRRFTPIHWAAEGYAWAFAVQAAGLLLLAARADLVVTGVPRRRAIAGALYAAALAWPLLAPVFGRPWTQAEVPALAPDPTVLALLALLLVADARSGFTRGVTRALRSAAAAWLLLSAATLFTMDEWQGAAPLLAVLLAAAALQPPRAQRKPM